MKHHEATLRVARERVRVQQVSRTLENAASHLVGGTACFVAVYEHKTKPVWDRVAGIQIGRNGAVQVGSSASL
jgi:hypothetical protein